MRRKRSWLHVGSSPPKATKNRQKMLNKPTNTRRFLGKTENFNSKQDQTFHQRMLRAYLRGAETFKFWGENYQVNQKLIQI